MTNLSFLPVTTSLFSMKNTGIYPWRPIVSLISVGNSTFSTIYKKKFLESLAKLLKISRHKWWKTLRKQFKNWWKENNFHNFGRTSNKNFILTWKKKWISIRRILTNISHTKREKVLLSWYRLELRKNVQRYSWNNWIKSRRYCDTTWVKNERGRGIHPWNRPV